MLDTIRSYIAEHQQDWGISDPTNWQLIFRTNLNYNYVKEYPLISRIIFWLDGGKLQLVTKVLDKSLSRESIDDCIDYEQNINKKLGYDLFPPLYDITEAKDYWVLFEPGMRGPTYETELKRAIFGPAATHPLINRVLERQFTEMGELCGKLLKITSPGWKEWGQTFRDMGEKLNTLLGDVLSSEQLSIMQRNIDSVPIANTPVIADLACQNIFPGPQLIDNLIPDIKGRNEALPGVINAFRFMVPIFYCPPLRNILDNWTLVLASALVDKKEEAPHSKPVRNLCRAVGFNPDNPQVIWAFIMGAVFFDMINALDFYKNCPSMDLKEGYITWIKDLVAVQETFNGR